MRKDTNLRLCIFEREETLSHDLQAAARALGYRVVLAFNTPALQHRFAANILDVLVTGPSITADDDEKAIAWIKQTYPGTAVVHVIAKDVPFDVAHQLTRVAGADAFLVCPFTATTFEATMSTALARRRP